MNFDTVYFTVSKDFPSFQIFKQIYTVQNTVQEDANIDFKSIRKYINSLQKASQLWYSINNPVHALHYEFISDEEAYWLVKLNHLGLRVFAALTLAVFLVHTDIKTRVDFLKAIEAFIFLNYHCAGRRSTLGNSSFPVIANELYNNKNEWTVEKIIQELHEWTYPSEEYVGYYSNELFILNIRNQFQNSKRNGYYDWSGLKYLLYEYEEYIQAGEPQKVKWSTPNSIEHIFPQSDADAEWKTAFKDFTLKQKKILCNSLGNLVLLRGSKNSQLSNNSFAFKKKHEDEEGNVLGYINGSHSEIEVSQYRNWSAQSIYKRGMKILKFVEGRWDIKLSPSEKKELLFSSEQLIEKINANA